MIFFISDLHLGHANIIRLCDRPFDTVEEMDNAIIENWNKKVRQSDLVYIIGDLVWDKSKVAYYMPKLNGRKILITGNHDATWAKKEENLQYFESVSQYMEISHEGHPITMCHYPMLEWKGSRRETQKHIGYHIHGHIHNNFYPEYRYLLRQFNALNAGADVNGFTPVTFSELEENNLRFKLSVLSEREDIDYLVNKEFPQE